ncbi:MAG TPA: DUF1569 domain-containing protein [Terriglobales bacterium]|nr:DUF1569 domain-containing protein [Terriglobales bacterium]
MGFILAALDSGGRAESEFMDSHLERLAAGLASAIDGAGADDLTWHREGKWCIAEILEHLYLSYTGTIKGFQRCLEAGRPLATSATLKQRVMAVVVVGFGRFPPGRKAPKNTQPRGIACEKVAADIGSQIVAMDEAIKKCEQRYGSSTKLLDHPILGPFTARQWRKFHWVHGRHHLQQILRLRGDRGQAPDQR